MKWNAIQTEARRKGNLVFAMSQEQTPVMTQPGPWGNAWSGFCNGCAVRWIALRYGGSDFAYDPKTWEVEMPDWQATRDQNIYENALASGGAGFPDELATGFNEYGLTLNRGRLTMLDQAPSGTILRGIGSSGEGCYYLSLRGPVGGHALALQNMGKSGWRFFDANYGEFSAKSADDFAKFIDWYMNKSRYNVAFTKTRGVGVNPPPYVGATFGSSVEDLIKKWGG